MNFVNYFINTVPHVFIDVLTSSTMFFYSYNAEYAFIHAFLVKKMSFIATCVETSKILFETFLRLARSLVGSDVVSTVLAPFNFNSFKR